MSEEQQVDAQADPSFDGSDLVRQANLAAERLEVANKLTADLIKRQEALSAQSILGGRSSAGSPPVKEESDEDYAKRVMSNDL